MRSSYRVGPFIVDGHVGEVTKDGKSMELSRTAFEVFYQLVQRRGNTVLKSEFEPWRDRYHEGRNPVDSYVGEIRKRLGDGVIVTMHGRGYRLSPHVPVETISTPSLSTLEQLVTITLDQINAHSSSSFVGTIKTCEELRKSGQIADAYPPMVLAYINLGHAGFCRQLHKETIAKAREIIDEAMRLFPTMGSAYALRGLTYLIYEYDWTKAEADLNEALRLSSRNELAHCFLGHLQVSQGRFEEGLSHARIAAEVDYESPMTVATVPWLTLFAGRVAEAVRLGEEIAERFMPYAPVHDLLGHIYVAAGEIHKAIEEYEKALEIDFLPDAVASLGFIYARMGDRKKALHQLALLEKAKKDRRIAYVPGYFEALVRAGLGEKGRCLNALEKAFEERCDWLIYLAVEPRWKELRNERRFRSLLRRVGIKRQDWF